jgi:hypothetical protein
MAGLLPSAIIRLRPLAGGSRPRAAGGKAIPVDRVLRAENTVIDGKIVFRG